MNRGRGTAMVALRELPPVDRPREKLLARGPEALSDTELLALVLGNGTRGQDVLSVATGLLRTHGLRALPQVPLAELRQARGLGRAKACQLVAGFELARRCLLPEPDDPPAVRTPEDVYHLTREVHGAKKEHFLALYLNARNRVLKKETVAVGSLNANLVHPREVFQPAVGEAAASVVLVHNHPSGDCEPSAEDLALTRRMAKAGQLMGIEVLDHVIVSHRGYVSLKERGHL